MEDNLLRTPNSSLLARKMRCGRFSAMTPEIRAQETCTDRLQRQRRPSNIVKTSPSKVVTALTLARLLAVSSVVSRALGAETRRDAVLSIISIGSDIEAVIDGAG